MAEHESLTDDEVTRLLPILANRVRASERSVNDFRPPQTGIVEHVSANWHHFIVGRRGVGKSMLLLTVEKQAREQKRPLAFIDLETLRDNPYPDVLIRLLVKIVDALDENLGQIKDRKTWRKRRSARRSLRTLRQRLDALLKDPQESAHQIREGRVKSRRHGIGGGASTRARWKGQGVSMDVHADKSTAATDSQERTADFKRTKLEGLRSELTEFRKVLKSAEEATGGHGAVVILDDFYFIRREDQPNVLTYLHSLVKGLDIWLKIGAVEHRLNEFEDGDPPRGLQLSNDAGKVAMDVTLSDFSHTREFLEGILQDVCVAGEVAVDSLVTETARTRLILASGGVPRDYLNLIQASLTKATRRVGERNRPKNKITAEDVTQAAPDFFQQKEDDLTVDARPEDAARLRSRFKSVLNFCSNHRGVNVFLVESRLLRDSQWGRDVAALSDLRFFHKLGNVTVKSSETTYVGKRFDAFALDLSSYASTRVRGTNEIDFWTTDGRERLRGASHVYSPEIVLALDQASERAQKKAAKVAPKQSEGQMSLDEVDIEPSEEGDGRGV